MAWAGYIVFDCSRVPVELDCVESLTNVQVWTPDFFATTNDTLVSNLFL